MKRKIITDKSYEDMVVAMGNAAGTVKLVCGAANNAAFWLMMRANDFIKTTERYNGSAGRYFRMAFKEFRDYENRLLYASETRMFHVADMSEDVRKKYGDITDRQYYEFWKGLGGEAYARTYPMITSLQNKYKLSLENHNVKDAVGVAWALTAQSGLEISVQLYDKAIEQCMKGYNLPKEILEYAFKQFRLGKVSKQWKTAVRVLSPDSDNYSLEHTEMRNITLGIDQLCEAWANPTMLYNSVASNVESYEEVFATPGQQKKAMREIAEIKKETEKELGKKL